MIEDHVPTQPTIAPFEWISVSHALPKEKGRYLVIDHGGYDLAWFDPERKTFSVDSSGARIGINRSVTHWMPLPKRPAEVLI